jgi:hypothetical protein
MKKACDVDARYSNFVHEALKRAHKRGLEFYLQVFVDWLNDTNLDKDMYFEFFIWDLYKRRFSSATHTLNSLMVGSDAL